ncbi:MAG TPA: CoA ester lyase [Thermomicrobiaceae bacterium]|nr:CoA ester lyase [Thermomicrobiaceae bacterium]
MILRSLLFAPANHERHAAKALSGSADGAILDLEDAVEVGQKPRARDLLVELIKQHQPGGPALFVRVNGLTTAFAYDDLVAVARPGVDGILLPKTESARDVHVADWLILQMELKHGLEQRSIRLFPIVETALGLIRIEEIACASPRVGRLSFGAGDFTLDTGIPWEPANEAVLAGRIRMVVVSRAAGLDAPLDTVYPDLRDTEGFAREAEQGKRLGFQGKACIHPTQVDIVNRIFSPSAEEVERARRLLSAFEEANRQGSASIQIDGDFVDYPVAERARRVIARAEQMGS